MKVVLLLVCGVISVVLAAPASYDSRAVIESYYNNIDEKGNYNFSFKTSNGIQRSENGEVNNVGQSDEHIVVTGEYSYTDADGKLVEVHYYADEHGFHVLPPVTIQTTTPPAGFAPAVSGNVVATLLG